MPEEKLWLVYHNLDERTMFTEDEVQGVWLKPNAASAPALASEARAGAGPQRLQFQLVAIVAGNSLEDIFTATNHISSQDWRTNPSVKAVLAATKGLRSTSVGDVLVEDSTQQAWRVAGCGFSKLTQFPNQPIE